MKTILFIILFPAALTGQYNWKRPLVAGSAAFVSGAAWGLHEKTMHHWPQFQQRFPRANPQYWNPAISWTNKYRDWPEDKRLRNVPVQFTDAKHLLASVNQGALFTAGVVITLGDRRPLWHYAADIAITSACYSIGNRLTFNWIY